MSKGILFELKRERRYTDGVDITGTLYINGVAVCYTLENSKYAIQAGLYRVEYCDSPKFGRKLPLIYNDLPGSLARGLRIHAGNTVSDTQGCILVGREHKWVGSSSPHSARLLESKAALDSLCRIIEMNPKRTMALVIYEG